MDTTPPAGDGGTPWVTVDQASELLGCDRRYLIAKIRSGEVKAVRLPSEKGQARRYRVILSELLDGVEEDLLTPDAAARLMSISKRQLYYLIETGWLKAVQMPSRRTGKPSLKGYRVPRWRLTEFYQRLEREGGARKTA